MKKGRSNMPIPPIARPTTFVAEATFYDGKSKNVGEKKVELRDQTTETVRTMTSRELMEIVAGTSVKGTKFSADRGEIHTTETEIVCKIYVRATSPTTTKQTMDRSFSFTSIND